MMEFSSPVKIISGRRLESPNRMPDTDLFLTGLRSCGYDRALMLKTVLFFLIFTCSLNTYSQQVTPGPTFPRAKYDDLYDLIFPKATKLFDALQDEYALDVRVRPSFRAPSHVQITKLRDGNFIVRLYTLSNENESLGSQIKSLLKMGVDNSIESLSKELHVVTKEYRTPMKLIPFINGFFAPINVPKTTSISLDGVGYDIWYVDSGSAVSYSLTGGDEYEKGEPSLISWARRLLKETRNLKRAKNRGSSMKLAVKSIAMLSSAPLAVCFRIA